MFLAFDDIFGDVAKSERLRAFAHALKTLWKRVRARRCSFTSTTSSRHSIRRRTAPAAIHPSLPAMS